MHGLKKAGAAPRPPPPFADTMLASRVWLVANTMHSCGLEATLRGFTKGNGLLA